MDENWGMDSIRGMTCGILKNTPIPAKVNISPQINWREVLLFCMDSFSSKIFVLSRENYLVHDP